MNERAIFNAASDISDPSARAAFLDRACADNPALRKDVVDLLREQDALGSFLARPPGVSSQTLAHAPLTEGPGTLIGPYKLLQKLGEGGMGVVYMAEQKEPVRRKVALKIIKPGKDSREVTARFEAERQALAMMDHVNIAKVLEAGTTDTGRPYFVMELVHGVSITKYCDDNKLNPRQRLELFIPVCQAIQHAHQKGIIHRDIKPSNVMVTMYDDKPVPKIIDFGVAKAVEQRLTEKSLFTQYGALVGTFEYMSPEQAEMNAFGVDTRSDIYSLGVLLYELLTGTTPLERMRLREAAYGEIVRLIKEEEPVRPSMRLSSSGAALADISRERGTEPAKLAKLVRGELDWIVMRCLEKDRARRYETASGLAQDVQRYLAEEPVLACPPSAWYRFRKMARRNKVAMTTGTLVAATLLLGFAVSAWQAVRATRAEDAALTANADAIRARDDEALQRQLAVANEEKAKGEGNMAKVARDAERVRAAELAVALKKAEQAERSEKLRAGELAVALNQTEEARLLEKQARQKAEANETKAEWQLYASNIASAQRAWESNNVSLLYHFLDQARADFRGWEHNYLYTLGNQNQQTLRGHKGPVKSVAFSPDGRRLASASPSAVGGPPGGGPSDVKLWDAVTGRLLLTFKQQMGHIYCVAFSPDGKCLASASYVGGGPDRHKVTLWDAASGKQIWTQPAGPNCVAFSPNGKHLAGSAGDKQVKLWDAASGKAILTLDGHTDLITSVAFSPDGRCLASASRDGFVKFWELASGQEYLTIKAHTTLDGNTGGVRSVAFSPDGKLLAIASSDKTVKLWDAATGQVVQTFKGHTGPVESVAFSPDGKRLASAGGTNDSTVKVWDTASGQEIQSLKGHRTDPTALDGYTDAVTSVAFSPDGKRLASASSDKTVKLWELGNDQDVLTIKAHPQAVHTVAFSPDGKRLASASSDKTVKLWDADSGKELLTLQGHTNAVTSVAFSPDGKRLASAANDATVKLWDAASGKEVLTIRQANNDQRVAFSPDGKRLAGATYFPGSPGDVRLWDAASGQEIQTLKGHAARVNSVAFSPDGKRLASASADKTVKLWDADSGLEIKTLNGHGKGVIRVAFSPDGKRLASASADKTVKLWDTVSGEELRKLKGHADIVLSVAFSPDGKRLASASADKTVKLWDTVSGEEVLTLRQASRVHSVVFSPDGKRLASAGLDGTIMIWDASKSMKDLEQK